MIIFGISIGSCYAERTVKNSQDPGTGPAAYSLPHPPAANPLGRTQVSVPRQIDSAKLAAAPVEEADEVESQSHIHPGKSTSKWRNDRIRRSRPSERDMQRILRECESGAGDPRECSKWLESVRGLNTVLAKPRDRTKVTNSIGITLAVLRQASI